MEALYEHLTQMLSQEGYGTGIDHAKWITIRRRWWLMHMLFEEDPFYELLQKDLEFWKSISMFNEGRELRFLLTKHHKLFSPSRWKDLNVFLGDSMMPGGKSDPGKGMPERD